MTTEQQPSDAELISAVRGGDTTAYGELLHPPRRGGPPAGAPAGLGRRRRRPGLRGVRQGAGRRSSAAAARTWPSAPTCSPRYAACTSTGARRGPAARRPTTSTPFDHGVPFRDTAVEGFENQAAAARVHVAARAVAARAVAHRGRGAPARRGQPAARLGRNAVAALAYRAREGLRQAFLTMHAQDAEDDACAWTQDNLGAYIRDGRRASATRSRSRAHIDECRRCMGIYLELVGGQHQPLRRPRPARARQRRRRRTSAARAARRAWRPGRACSAGSATSSAATPRPSPWPGPRP